MLSHYLVDVTGLVALSLNLSALVRSSDRALVRTTGLASAIWALNNLLIGAQTAAALSALSVGRQVSASFLRDQSMRTKAIAVAIIAAATLLIAAATWSGFGTMFPVLGSLMASYAMFYMRDAALRWAMVAVNALWMVNAVAAGSWWQIAANGIAGAAGVIGAWRARPGRMTPARRRDQAAAGTGTCCCAV
jgi:hypothetical protein